MSRWVYLVTLLASATALAQPAPAPAPAEPAAPPAPAPAPAPEPTPDEAAARVHLVQGGALINDGNFSAALAEFEEAYRIHPSPVIWNDIAIAQQKMFHYGDAIVSFQRFLDETPGLDPELRAHTEQIIRELHALLADVAITGAPSGALITVDGKPAGTAPLARPLVIPAGGHSVVVTAPGFEPQKQDVLVSGGSAISLAFALRSIATTGKLHITSVVSHARIAIDGHDAGLAPVDMELPAGPHTVEVSAPKYDTRHDDIMVAAGQTRDLPMSLDATVHQRSWYSKWYVVTPLALVLVGIGGGVAIGLTSHPAPIQGTLGAGQAQ